MVHMMSAINLIDFFIVGYLAVIAFATDNESLNTAVLLLFFNAIDLATDKASLFSS